LLKLDSTFIKVTIACLILSTVGFLSFNICDNEGLQPNTVYQVSIVYIKLEATQFSYHVAQDSLASELILYVEPPFDFRGSSLTNLYLELLKGAAIQSASLNETILITNRISFNFAIRSTSKRRNEYEIISQILTALTSGALAITELALYSKLNFRNAKLYMDLLVKKGLVFTIDENGRMKYMISDRGYAFLRNFQALKSLL